MGSFYFNFKVVFCSLHFLLPIVKIVLYYNWFCLKINFKHFEIIAHAIVYNSKLIKQRSNFLLCSLKKSNN